MICLTLHVTKVGYNMDYDELLMPFIHGQVLRSHAQVKVQIAD